MSYQQDRIKGIPSPLPADYDRQANFTDYEIQHPGEPPRGPDLDAEFNAVEQALDETQARLRLIQRDDGAVASNSIGLDQLKNEARVGVNTPTTWAEFTQYAVNDSVIDPDGAWYVAQVSHVSSDDFEADLAQGQWRQLIDLVPHTTEARNWATRAEDDPVPEGDGTQFSALHHSIKASESRVAAEFARDVSQNIANDIGPIEARLRDEYQAADANLQNQISDTQPLEASAFSPISWHKQTVDNSVIIPEERNAWSFGPTMTIASGQSVTIGPGSFWTIANGEASQ